MNPLCSSFRITTAQCWRWLTKNQLLSSTLISSRSWTCHWIDEDSSLFSCFMQRYIKLISVNVSTKTKLQMWPVKVLNIYFYTVYQFRMFHLSIYVYVCVLFMFIYFTIYLLFIYMQTLMYSYLWKAQINIHHVNAYYFSSEILCCCCQINQLLS